MDAKIIDSALSHCFGLNLDQEGINIVRALVAERVLFGENHNLFSKFCTYLNNGGVTKLNDISHLMHFMLHFDTFVSLERGIEASKRIANSFPEAHLMSDHAVVIRSGRVIQLPPRTTESVPGSQHEFISLISSSMADNCGSQYDTLDGMSDDDDDGGHGGGQPRPQTHDDAPSSSEDPDYIPSGSEHAGSEYPDPVITYQSERDQMLDSMPEMDERMASHSERFPVPIVDWRTNGRPRRQSLQNVFTKPKQTVLQDDQVVEEPNGSVEEHGQARERRYSLGSRLLSYK